MTIRPDNRLTTMPMRPVVCRQCGTEVLVRKASWAQTTVQWGPEARAACKTPPPSGYGFCPALRESIKEAVIHGTLEIVPEGPTGPDDEQDEEHEQDGFGAQDEEHEFDAPLTRNGVSPNGSATRH